MTGERIDPGTCERLAHLWNHRHELRKPEWLEFYELLTQQVWPRVNVRPICRRLLVDPADARHDCFVNKVYAPSRGSVSAASTDVAPEKIVGYFVLMLRRYLVDQLRRQDVDRGGAAVINLTDAEWNVLIHDHSTVAEATGAPLLTAEFERRLRDDVMTRAREFMSGLEREDRILLKCWYAQNPQPPLYWFGRIMSSPDYRARRLGLNPCRSEYVDYGKTRIGKWARSLGLDLARDRYAEVHVVLEMLKALASMDQTIDCSELTIGPPPSGPSD
jgi:hypothetical protein